MTNLILILSTTSNPQFFLVNIMKPTTCCIVLLLFFTESLVTACRLTIDDFKGQFDKDDVDQVTLTAPVNGPWVTVTLQNGTIVEPEQVGRLCHDGKGDTSKFAIMAELLRRAAGIDDCDQLEAGKPYRRSEDFETDCGELEKYVPEDSFNIVVLRGVIRDPPAGYVIDSKEEWVQLSNEVEYDAAHYLIYITLSLESS
ncbi:uncharacterized protein LOC135164866 isoform X2 [Diachasmimorpha longicaudata]|uniref:uncharacterized protein LOC135164866 isoform X2 n=2 Tax=Diachasmimorpha longicaudata TaxID=58733 RepID=UPI0030B89BA9